MTEEQLENAQKIKAEIARTKAALKLLKRDDSDVVISWNDVLDRQIVYVREQEVRDMLIRWYEGRLEKLKTEFAEI